MTAIATTTTHEPAWLDEHAAARRLGLAAITLRVWRREGRGPTYAKLGSRVRYRVDDIDAWAAAQRVTPRPTAQPTAQQQSVAIARQTLATASRPGAR